MFLFRSIESLPNAELGSKRVDDLLHWEITNFKIHQFRPGHGFLAALAVTAGEVRLHHYLYPEQMKIQC